ncbi:MAG: response regulator [Candidatus Onthomonas sp.]
MYKVFLVEDEIIVRDGLKTIVPWQQYGFMLVGDASDGETALPRIRQTRPDILITDIRMPFMDGLALARIVRGEMPNIRIIILSGYDDFAYAQQAIQVGVERYLLKPITKATLIKTLSELREKIDAEQEQAVYYEKFRTEAQEYEQFSRRRFFERLVSGQLSVSEIYEQAAGLGLDVSADRYNIVQFTLQQGSSDQYFEPLTQLQDELIQALGCCPEILLFRWNLTTYAALIKGHEQDIEENTRRCVESIARRCEGAPAAIEWYVAAGKPVSRLSLLPGCFTGVSRLLSYRFLYPQEHLLTNHDNLTLDTGEEEHKLQNLDISSIDPARINNFLQTGLHSEVEDFVAEYIQSIGAEAMKSMLFCQYILLSIRFTTTAYVENQGLSRERLLDCISAQSPVPQIHTLDQIKEYISALLACAIDLREESSAGRYHSLMAQTREYIEQHYTDESLSLNTVARAVNLSASYFSALFSQEMGKTFTEYVTEKRMERACTLLRTTKMRSSEIAFAVGYRDAHYFSFLFKKTQGCTPRDYRSGVAGAKR